MQYLIKTMNSDDIVLISGFVIGSIDGLYIKLKSDNFEFELTNPLSNVIGGSITCFLTYCMIKQIPNHLKFLFPICAGGYLLYNFSKMIYQNKK